MSGTLRVLRGDARDLPLPDASVDLIVTSPPYFALRSYTDGGQHYAGQIGDEPTPADFIGALLEVTRECVRVLKPSGSLWVNLGDKYSSGGRSSYDTSDLTGARGGARGPDGMRPKTLLGIPWRYALACIDQLGLILRAEVIWSKPNGLPESVTDRVRRSHEQWFHFTVQPRYYSAVDEIREPHLLPTNGATFGGKKANAGRVGSGERTYGHNEYAEQNPLGKLPGSVWTVPTEPLRVPEELGVDHFAAFPSEWPKRLILGWSPREVCSACGEGRRPVVVADRSGINYTLSEVRSLERIDASGGAVSGGTRRSTLGHQASRVITGYACACPDTAAPATPGVVLDPFGGTGTTAHVAAALGRTGISVDLSADYCRIAAHPDLRKARAAKVLGVPKPAPQLPGQTHLFDDLGGAA